MHQIFITALAWYVLLETINFWYFLKGYSLGSLNLNEVVFGFLHRWTFCIQILRMLSARVLQGQVQTEKFNPAGKYYLPNGSSQITFIGATWLIGKSGASYAAGPGSNTSDGDFFNKNTLLFAFRLRGCRMGNDCGKIERSNSTE